MAGKIRPPIRRHATKPPVPKHYYKLVTVGDSSAACRLETALLERMAGRFGVSLFTICHVDGDCDVMGDSGTNPLSSDRLREVRALAAAIKGA